jgi:hypothetical protein
MAIEKIGSGRAFSHIVGAGLIAGGVAFLFTAFAAHWPAMAALR